MILCNMMNDCEGVEGEHIGGGEGAYRWKLNEERSGLGGGQLAQWYPNPHCCILTLTPGLGSPTCNSQMYTS